MSIHKYKTKKRNPILCQLLHWLRCLWKEKKALKERIQNQKRGKIVRSSFRSWCRRPHSKYRQI